LRLFELLKPIKKTLYVSRTLLNADDIKKWAKHQGFDACVSNDEMHVTIVYSRKEVDWSKTFPKENDVEIFYDKKHPRSIEKFGEDKNAVVLTFHSKELSLRNKFFIEDIGCSKDHEFKPHVTITYDGKDIDIAGMKPYTGVLKFGPETFEEVK